MADVKTSESDKTKQPGAVSRGADRPDDRSGDRKTVQDGTGGFRTVLVQGGLTDVTGNAGPNRGVVFGDGRDRMPGTFIMPNAVSRNTWQTERARLEQRQADIHAASVADRQARHDALMGEVKAAGKRADARKAALANGTDFSSLGKISADLWNGWGQLNGQNGAGGSMLDTKGRASDIAALNKWFNSAEAQQYRGYVPAGVATRDMKNGVREFSLVNGGENLTTAQFDALMQVKAQSDRRFSKLRADLAKASGPSQYDRDVQLYLDRGGKLEFDRETGVMKTSRDTISKVAQAYRMNDAAEALRGLSGADERRAQLKSIVGDEVGGLLADSVEARRAGRVASAFRDLGFANRDIYADDGSGRVDAGKLRSAFAARFARPVQTSAPAAASRKAAPKSAVAASPNAGAAVPNEGTAASAASPDLGDFSELRAAARDVSYAPVSRPMDRLRKQDPFVAAGMKFRGGAPKRASDVPVGPGYGTRDAQRAARSVPRTPPSVSDGRIPQSDDFTRLMSGSGGAMNDAAGYARLRQAAGAYNPDAATWRDPAYRSSAIREGLKGAGVGALYGLELSGIGKLLGTGVRAGTAALAAAAERRAAGTLAAAATSGALSKGVRKATQRTLVNAFTKEAPVATVAGASQVPGGVARAAERYYAGAARAASRDIAKREAAARAAGVAARRRAGAAAARAAKAEEAAYVGQAVEAAMSRKGFRAAASRAVRRRHN